MAGTLHEVGKFCESGGWQDLTPYIEQSNYDLSQFSDAVFKYTSYAGSRCALKLHGANAWSTVATRSPSGSWPPSS